MNKVERWYQLIDDRENGQVVIDFFGDERCNGVDSDTKYDGMKVEIEFFILIEVVKVLNVPLRFIQMYMLDLF